MEEIRLNGIRAHSAELIKTKSTLSRLITAETGNYDRASLKIPSLTVSLGKQLELISLMGNLISSMYTLFKTGFTLPHLPEDENFVHSTFLFFLSFKFTPLIYFDLTTLSFYTVLILYFFENKGKKKNFNRCTRETSSRHSLNPIRSLNPTKREEDDPLSLSLSLPSFVSIPFERLFKVWKETRFDQRRVFNLWQDYARIKRLIGNISGPYRFELIEIGRIEDLQS